MNIRPFTAVIENIRPLVDGGRYPVKRVVGERLVVEADVFKEGHDVLSTVLKWRRLGEGDCLLHGPNRLQQQEDS